LRNSRRNSSRIPSSVDGLAVCAFIYPNLIPEWGDLLNQIRPIRGSTEFNGYHGKSTPMSRHKPDDVPRLRPLGHFEGSGGGGDQAGACASLPFVQRHLMLLQVETANHNVLNITVTQVFRGVVQEHVFDAPLEVGPPQGYLDVVLSAHETDDRLAGRAP